MIIPPPSFTDFDGDGLADVCEQQACNSTGQPGGNTAEDRDGDGLHDAFELSIWPALGGQAELPNGAACPLDPAVEAQACSDDDDGDTVPTLLEWQAEHLACRALRDRGENVCVEVIAPEGPFLWSGALVQPGDTLLTDLDGDGLPASRDEDADGDGQPDILEAVRCDAQPAENGFHPCNFVNFDDSGAPLFVPFPPEVDVFSSDLQAALADGFYWHLTFGDDLPPQFDDDPTDDPQIDLDGDGLTNAEEALNNSDPSLPDTDGDGLQDGVEVSLGSDPNNIDDDGDGIPTLCELRWAAFRTTDGVDPLDCTSASAPTVPDSLAPLGFGVDCPADRDCDRDGDSIPDMLDDDDDGDGRPTASEVNPWVDCGLAPPDADGDGLPDHLDDDDTDGPLGDLEDGVGDGLPRCFEGLLDCDAAFGDPAASRDADGDGLSDAQEASPDPLPTLTDVEAWAQVSIRRTDGLNADICNADDDGDSLPTALEVELDASFGFGDLDMDGQPGWRDADLDGDGLLDCYEVGWLPDDVDTTIGCPDVLFDNLSASDLPDADGDGLPDLADNGSVPVADLPDRTDRLVLNEGVGCSATSTSLPRSIGWLMLPALGLLRRRSPSLLSPLSPPDVTADVHRSDA